MDAVKTCVKQNISKANFDGCVTKLSKNQLQKSLWKPFLIIFYEIFSNRPHPNVKGVTKL